MAWLTRTPSPRNRVTTRTCRRGSPDLAAEPPVAADADRVGAAQANAASPRPASSGPHLGPPTRVARVRGPSSEPGRRSRCGDPPSRTRPARALSSSALDPRPANGSGTGAGTAEQPRHEGAACLRSATGQPVETESRGATSWTGWPSGAAGLAAAAASPHLTGAEAVIAGHGGTEAAAAAATTRRPRPASPASRTP